VDDSHVGRRHAQKCRGWRYTKRGEVANQKSPAKHARLNETEWQLCVRVRADTFISSWLWDKRLLSPNYVYRVTQWAINTCCDHGDAVSL
jgi:hypothetical protein